jgi:hypothetical protein
VEKYCRPGQATKDSILRRTRFAGCIIKAMDKLSEYVTLTAFPLKQWLLERVSLLRYTHIARLVLLT